MSGGGNHLATLCGKEKPTMKRSLITSILAGAFAFGCGSMRPSENTAQPPQAKTEPETQPNAVTGAAGTTGTGIDSTGNPEAGDATGQTGTQAPNPNEQPGLETGETQDTTKRPTGEPQQNDTQDDDEKTETPTAPKPDSSY